MRFACRGSQDGRRRADIGIGIGIGMEGRGRGMLCRGKGGDKGGGNGAWGVQINGEGYSGAAAGC